MNITFTDLNHYLATFTYPNGLTKELIEKIKSWCRSQIFCLATLEYGENGTNPHIHAIIGCSSTKSRDLRRVLLKVVYGYGQKDEVPKNLLNVKVVSSISGAIRYISKETDKYIVQVGFQKTFIDKQLEDSFAAKKFFTKWKYIKVDQVPGMIYEFCKMRNRSIDNRNDFADVIEELSETINVRSWRRDMPWIYAQTRKMFGANFAMKRWVLDTIPFYE